MSLVLEENVPARMRDGVTLLVDVFRPAAPGRYPVLLMRTPYGKDRNREFGDMACEGHDGYDSAEWAAALPFSTGAVGMFGLSYLGTVQWVAANEKPPHLQAIAPMQASTKSLSAFLFRPGRLDITAIVPLVMQAAMARLRTMEQGEASPAERASYFRQLVDAMDRLYADGYRELPLGQLASLDHLGMAEVFAPILAGDRANPRRSRWTSAL